MTSLNRTASWVIVRRAEQKAVLETYNLATADQFRADPAYEVVPILEWLQRVNRRAGDAQL